MEYAIRISAAWTDEETAFGKKITRQRKEDWTHSVVEDTDIVGAIRAALRAGPEGCARATEMTIKVEAR